ncbi:hypothetical protein [Mycobacteroides abscessus]|uniref:hypothetical protein n=1 Tax=Mycobacteroides abscessus TaxID=36809 RepID=UPI0009A64A0B|nr:hypothetical protein [Mycobacteroides abscessus]SKH88425.1 Uncharacterised protein [Mycobacteroides abscessus subsp. massiliense]SKH92266.1 Uncharacterised protein [Mycobacteroides abscessus subsp. massiliense]SKI12661.1 Uncharacterised protein [Mycobacteroides abscessus subsp. massiliense]SKK21198.1 Uncharacterised protein [Mycobacteroides abscessus subsp. massiliense]SKK32007.1 Uncharacterised protein [Mycobacteroides abscessus subsp. massiliense]
MSDRLSYEKAVALSGITNDMGDLLKEGREFLEANGSGTDADPVDAKRLAAGFAIRAVFAVDSPFTTDGDRQRAVRDVLARYLGGLDTVDPAKITEALDMYVPEVMREFTKSAGTEQESTQETADRKCEYLCLGGSADTVIYVSSAGGGDGSFRMYVGTLDEPLREVEVFAVERMRDGGTTYIFTAEGTFFAPTRRAEDPRCWWPTTDSCKEVCGWPLPDTCQVREPVATEQAFNRVDAAQYAVIEDPQTGGVIVRDQARAT